MADKISARLNSKRHIAVNKGEKCDDPASEMKPEPHNRSITCLADSCGS